ncbi:MAG TPA: hypothetical protein VMU41_13270 [Candidatus Binataceae bacterium]|nr:hypothetical protein [Candidatus Binataceae bacterium]
MERAVTRDWRVPPASISNSLMRSPFFASIILATLSLAACHHTATFTCPPGDTLMGAPPPKGEEVWCQKIVNGKPVKEGPFIVYGEGNDKLIQGSYRDGVQEGEWTTWYANGQRSAVDHFHNGLQDGLHTSWYFNGVKSIEGEYRMGKREGVWTRWDPTGYTSKQETYRDDHLVH